jgi:hypothetical protein
LCNGELELNGTIIAARAPHLLWIPDWDLTGNHGRKDPDITTDSVGWETRRYAWDERVSTIPPPFMPWSGTWEFARWRNVNVDCLTSVSEDPGCA